MNPNFTGESAKRETLGLFTQFFSSLSRSKFILATLVVSFWVAGVFTWMDTIITRNVAYASLETLFLAAELNCEAGPDFSAARAMHVRLLKQSIARMEARFPRPLLAALPAKYSPRMQLQKAIDVLVSADASDSASDSANKQAAAILAKTGTTWSGARLDSELRKLNSPDETSLVHDYLALFDNSAEAFRIHPTMENAERACMDSRLACAMLLRYWFNGAQVHHREIAEFTARLDYFREDLVKFAEVGVRPERNHIRAYAVNVNRRLNLLATLNSGDLSGSRVVLQAALAKR